MNLFDNKHLGDRGCVLISDKFIGMAEMMIPTTFLIPMNMAGWKTLSVKEGKSQVSTLESSDGKMLVSFYPSDKNTVVISCSYIKNEDYSYLPKSSGEIVKHSYYTLSYSENHEQAEW